MIPPSTTLTDEGRRTRRTLLWVLGLVIGLNVIVWVGSALSSGGSVAGPEGSSFVTTRAGSAAAAGLLERLGYPVEQSRVTLDALDLDPTASLVLIDVAGADYASAELNELEAFLQAGGSVLVAGRTDVVGRLFADAPEWVSDGSAMARPVGELAGSFGDVALSEFGSLEPAAGDTAILQGDDGAVIGVSRPVGEGRFVWVADSHPFHNEGIGVGDSSVAFITLLDAAGTVVFDEYRHGFRQEAGFFAVLPANWTLTLALLAVAGLLALIAYGRRFGPPHDLRRRLAPGREAYLEAVAGMLTRSGSTDDAIAVIRGEAVGRLQERAGAEADLAHAAAGAGLDEAAITAVLGAESDHDTLLAADRALAILNRERR